MLVGGISVVGLILEGLRRWTVSAGTPRAKPAAVRVRAKAKKLVARKKKKIAAPIAKRARSAAKRVAQKTLSH